MNHKRLPKLTAAFLVLAAASTLISATRQPQPESPRHCTDIAEQMATMSFTLNSAITTAEKNTDGRAIAARVVMADSVYLSELFSAEVGGTGPGKPAERRPSGSAKDPQTPNKDMDRATSPDRFVSESDRMYAIVTCVMDEARVREVVVEMPTKKVLGVFAMPALRADFDRDERDPSDRYSAPSLVRGTNLMNATVRNADGERVGDIDDLAIDPDTNRLVYGVLRRGGFLGMGESRYAIASSELVEMRGGIIQMNLRSDDFKDHAGFASENWPMRFDPEWSTRDQDERATEAVAKSIVKGSDVIGSTVHCLDENQFGTITDLIVDPANGRVVYAVVKAEHGRMVVPCGALVRFEDDYRLQLGLEDAKSMPVIEGDREPAWNDARWNRQLRERYSAVQGVKVGPKNPTKRPGTPPTQPR